MEFHDDRLFREEFIRDYLLKRLDSDAAERFETHYLACDECFEELRASELLIAGLGQPKIELRRLDEVTVLEFTQPARLTRQSQELNELWNGVTRQSDTKVLIDLSRVSKIDSTGLGLLMTCYSHAVKNQGMLKLLNPSADLRRLLRVTRIDSVLESYDDEQQALRSFEGG